MTTEKSKFSGWQIACVLAQPHMQAFLREQFPFVDHNRVFAKPREATNDDILPVDLVRWGEHKRKKETTA